VYRIQGREISRKNLELLGDVPFRQKKEIVKEVLLDLFHTVAMNGMLLNEIRNLWKICTMDGVTYL
jgi:hypothetical protein